MKNGDDHFQPILVFEVIDYLAIRPGEWYLDATLGQAGHAEAILKKGGCVFGIDQDPEAILAAGERLARFGRAKIIKLGRFSQLGNLVGERKFAGVLFDLGMSNLQLGNPDRGFSFLKDGPLDMRMSPQLGVLAADLINGLTGNELSKLFQKYGEEKRARRLADAVVRRRRLKPILQTGELADLIAATVGRKRGAIHPATRVFQALRIAVNDELGELEQGLNQALKVLSGGGRLVVISFQSLEDRLVKHFYKGTNELEVLTAKPVRPSLTEVEANPRSRSAKLRAAEFRGGIKNQNKNDCSTK